MAIVIVLRALVWAAGYAAGRHGEAVIAKQPNSSSQVVIPGLWATQEHACEIRRHHRQWANAETAIARATEGCEVPPDERGRLIAHRRPD